MDTHDSVSSWHIYCIQTDGRDDLIVYARERGIETGVHYKPIHQHACYGDQPSLPAAEEVSKKILSLPMHPGLTDDDVHYVVDTLHSFTPPSRSRVQQST